MNLDRFSFKAKKINSKKWLYAGLDDSEELLHWLLRDENNSKYDPAWIDPETLCQCTGLRDSNGRRIYENDIIRTTDEEGKTAEFVVKYNERDMSYEADGKTAKFPLPFVKFYIERGIKWEVVGNTWDKEPENEQGNN
ncbi:MAG: hypothetical protein IJG38_02125 [Thermoguttaceae bacterium]|nr:hypothetical protein [Thermoguttaceae bacterium]